MFEELLFKFFGRIFEVKDKEGIMFFYLVFIFKIEECRIDKINLLLFLGVDVNEVNLCGRLVIFMVCKNGDECVVRYFV